MGLTDLPPLQTPKPKSPKEDGVLSKKRVYEMRLGEVKFELIVDELNEGDLKVWVRENSVWVGNIVPIDRGTLERLCLLFNSARDDQR